jgi:hypothetical protein
MTSRQKTRVALGRFDFTLESSDAGLRKLDRWIANNGAFLAVRKTGGCSFETFVPAWRDERLGQNVIFDLATFIGEVVIERNPGFHWEIYRAIPAGARNGDPSLQHIVIRGPDPRIPWRIWPFNQLYRACHDRRERSLWQKRRSFVLPRDWMKHAATFIRSAQDRLACAGPRRA